MGPGAGSAGEGDDVEHDVAGIRGLAVVQRQGCRGGHETQRALHAREAQAAAGGQLVVAPAALEAVTAWAFGEAGFHRLELQHSTGNPASCRVAEKTGFALEGTRVRSLLHDDGWHDMHLHGRVADR